MFVHLHQMCLVVVNKKLELTPVVPTTAVIEDGSMNNMLNNSIEGVTLMRFVAALHYAPRLRGKNRK